RAAPQRGRHRRMRRRKLLPRLSGPAGTDGDLPGSDLWTVEPRTMRPRSVSVALERESNAAGLRWALASSSAAVLVALLSMSTTAVLWWGLGSASNENSDYTSFYEPVAQGILDGQGLLFNGKLALRYPPGYPVILAGLFRLSTLTGFSRLGVVTAFNVVVIA